MIDKNKQYQTRDGREVRVFMTDGGDWKYPVIAAYKSSEGHWWPLHLTKDGAYVSSGSNSVLDIIEVKPRIKRKVWVNLYRHDDGDEFAEVSSTEDLARERLGTASIACVEIDIDVEEGHGL